MTKFLRLLAIVPVLLLAVTFATAPAANAFVFPTTPPPTNPPKCYSGLSHSGYPDPAWTYSHDCYEGDHQSIWHVYIDFKGTWHLTSSTILP